MDFRARFCPCFFGESEIWFTNWDSFRTKFGSVVNHVLKNFPKNYFIGHTTKDGIIKRPFNPESGDQIVNEAMMVREEDQRKLGDTNVESDHQVDPRKEGIPTWDMFCDIRNSDKNKKKPFFHPTDTMNKFLVECLKKYWTVGPLAALKLNLFQKSIRIPW